MNLKKDINPEDAGWNPLEKPDGVVCSSCKQFIDTGNEEWENNIPHCPECGEPLCGAFP